ncbi:uncharacterized protein LOC122154304 isoform X2 [Tyto alba]|uniref:uncharacterized protein LOC122154304 isoform X2 n=1 Tax=Tyto alba TaxID=56313 RepID=UPI001C676D84|nr:uncharacterized protein LOC122154304 isoform X2 [Tyto alba]
MDSVPDEYRRYSTAHVGVSTFCRVSASVCLFTCSFPEEPHNVVWRGATHHPRDEAAGNGYEASHLNVGWESLGHPGEGDAALQLGSGSATAGDGTGTSWLFPPLQSCPLTAQRSAGRAPLQVFPTGGLFQLLGWIRRKSLAGIPGVLQELKEEKTPGAIRSHLANTRGAGENTGDRRSGCAGVGVSRRKQWLTARLCLSKGGDASSGVRAKSQ